MAINKTINKRTNSHGAMRNCINVAAVEAEFRKFESMNKGIIDLIPAAVEAVKQETMKKMILFSSNGKGVLDQPSQDELVKAVVQGVLKEIVGK